MRVKGMPIIINTRMMVGYHSAKFDDLRVKA